ncbi:SapC family protein [Sphingomonas nostoxanthinifaciens]|uniref:SapC family protein n=1 Tax=Sphingomonas nostoxanthinifaciens TaxID=2872652 RepID=UPI001CC1E25B|nr:SapC family protein [Sphingomonas nostoxanthinifaciens]UAK23564.1 SapC family protein [Sphingomonas nostoxanthinifaciens]
MASAAPQGLPLLYNDLVPLSKNEHAGYSLKPMESLAFIQNVHALPVTVDEFLMAQRTMPIVFSSGPDPVPLALMGLNEGINTFVGEDGKLADGAYLPAFVRRYPFMLARLQPNSDDMTLCFDPTAGLVVPDDTGLPLFADGEPTEHVTNALNFCQEFEMSAQRTGQFVRDLQEMGLLEDGEITIQNEQFPQPFVYRGFQMVSEAKLRELRGDQLRKMNQNNMLPLIFAHLFSLSLMSDVFGRQMVQGKVPAQIPSMTM